MRIVAWNCAGGFHRKIDALMALRPDVAVISECLTPEALAAKTALPAFSSPPLWMGRPGKKGLGVFCFNGIEARRHRHFNPDLNWILPVRITAPHRVDLLAVWAQNANAGIRRKDQPGPMRLALDFYRSFLRGGNAVITGDLNNNVIWDKPGWPMNQAEAVRVLGRRGMVSAYHEMRGEAQGAETTPTHYWRDRKNDGPTYHIDHMFVPRPWLPRITRFEVGSFEDWTGNGLSDHVPLICDVRLV